MAQTVTTLISKESGERIDIFLALNIPGLTRTAAQKLIASGLVTLCGKPVQKSHKTAAEEVYVVTRKDAHTADIIGQNIPLDVVFEDDDVIVINKPRGLVVHPAPGHRDNTLVNALLYHCKDSLSGIGGVIRPGIVHRIDKDTSGLLIAAKNDSAHTNLAAQLASRTLKREYEAIVCGILKPDTGSINAPIGRHPKDRKKQAVLNDGSGREAVTHYQVLSRFSSRPHDGYTHIRLILETGRTHQIRVHLAHLGYPILGDKVYGRRKSTFDLDSQCLHAKSLSFVHPKTKSVVELITVLPDYFRLVLEALESRETA